MILFIIVPVSAQTVKASIKASEYHLNPLLLSSFKKPAKANPLLAEYIKPTKYELMRWSNYPLTAAQIEARNKEWDRQNNRSLGEQIAGDILETYLKAVLSGKKQVVAVRPRF
ncbi:MAG: hypothetical protein ABIR78_13110 [Ferruginibacter sp.]